MEKCTLVQWHGFWLGLFICVILIGMSAKYGLWSFSVLIAYGIGYLQTYRKHEKYN